MKGEKRNLVLIGFMGSGKTTVGRKLSYRLRMPMEDTDRLIEQREKKSIRQMFDEEGERFFRACETKLLRELTQRAAGPRIYSVGGGTPAEPANRPLLKELGTVIWLRVRPDTVYRRLRGDTVRPLLQCPDPLERIRSLMEERGQAYRACADVTVDADDMSAAQITEQILRILDAKNKEAPFGGGEAPF